MNGPSMLDLIAEAPVSWPQVRRAEWALSRKAEAYRRDADRLRAAPDPGWPDAHEVYSGVADELEAVARELRRDAAGRAAVGE